MTLTWHQHQAFKITGLLYNPTSRVCMLHQRYLELQRRYRNTLKVLSLSQMNGEIGVRVQPSQTSAADTRLGAPDGKPTSDFRHLVERNQNFGAMQSALSWIKDRHSTVDHAPFGDNRTGPSCSAPFATYFWSSMIDIVHFSAIIKATKRYEVTHKEIEAFEREIQHFRSMKSHVSANEMQFYEALLDDVETQYANLKVCSVVQFV